MYGSHSGRGHARPQRAPNGFTQLHEVISRAELEEIAGGYKQIAGFNREELNAKANI